jgi:hypothetical protein
MFVLGLGLLLVGLVCLPHLFQKPSHLLIYPDPSCKPEPGEKCM